VILAAASTSVRWTSPHDMEDPAASIGADEQGESELADAELAGAAERAETSAPAARLPASALDNEALARLIGRVMRQDEAALATLYEHLSGQVYALALHITRQVASAEEVMQDTFWQIWRQAPRFDAQRGSAMAWVLTMARSRALDAARANARDPLQSRRAAVDENAEFGDDAADDPLDLLHAVRRDSQLHSVLAALDPLRRQLIALAFYRGLTQDEIATQTGLPLGTVKSHFRRTLAALKTALGAEFGLGRPETQR
jgi:RNA polymerase sigma factor (sigma-70 family)